MKLTTDIFDLYDGIIFVEMIISDDNSTMRSHSENVKNGGKLPDRIPQPVFGADVSHRVKVMTKPMFAMVAPLKTLTLVKTSMFYGFNGTLVTMSGNIV